MQVHVAKGRAIAQLNLGNAYRQGQMGLEKEPERGFALYELAARQGHALAQNMLGIFYGRGEIVEMNQETSAQWHRLAAEQGHPDGQSNLGRLYFFGLLAQSSYDEAVKWYRLAAAQGHPEATFMIDYCYTNGQGLPQDHREALRFYKRAAAKGHAMAAVAVSGAELNIAEAEAAAARDWRETPVWRGLEPCGLCALPLAGGVLSTGRLRACCCKMLCAGCSDKHLEGCPLCTAPRCKLAADWVRQLRKHADKGNADAQFELANAYVQGDPFVGLQRSFERAAQMFELAAVQGHADA